MTDRIKGKPGGPFEGLEFVVAYIGCDNCVARSAGCRIPCLQAVPDPTISGNWIKAAPAIPPVRSEKTYRGYDFSGPDKDDDLCLEWDGECNCVWLSRQDVEGMLKRWTNKPAPAQQDAPPTVPGWYWVKCCKRICIIEVTKYGLLHHLYSPPYMQDCQFDGPISPPERWGDGNNGSTGQEPA
jgi:hypothetical protein